MEVEVIEEGNVESITREEEVEEEKKTKEACSLESPIEDEVNEGDEKKQKISLISLIDSQIENNTAVLFSHCSHLVRALVDDENFRFAKNQPVLNQLKLDIN